jgi:hypothetical protein
MTLPPADAYVAIADGEELLAAACAAVAERLQEPAEVHRLTGEHLQVATLLHARPRKRRRDLQLTLLATLASSAGGELGVLTWLRKQEQRLVDSYMALDASLGLAPIERRRLRRYLVPRAFARFARLDQIIMQREEQDVYA